MNLNFQADVHMLGLVMFRSKLFPLSL